jgi:hypothetical protein
VESWFDAILPQEDASAVAPSVARCSVPRVRPASAAAVGPALAQPCDDDRPLSGKRLRAALRERDEAQPEREPWPSDWFDVSSDPSDVERVRAMWGKALSQLVKDALAEMLRDLGRRAAANYGQIDSLSWLRSRSFLEVAELAGLDRDFAERLRGRLHSLFAAEDRAALEAIWEKLVARDRGDDE